MVALDNVRRDYQRAICEELVAFYGDSHIPTIADRTSPGSVDLSCRLISALGMQLGAEERSQETINRRFCDLTAEFIIRALSVLHRANTQDWSVVIGGMASDFVDLLGNHSTLPRLQRALAADPQVRTELDRYYLITPDIIVGRKQARASLAEGAQPTAQRELNGNPSAPSDEGGGGKSFVRASISCNWMLRSNQIHSVHTEPLNLIRTQECIVPHIMVVTFEPLPNRLASIALGSGDIDCTYHVALHELRVAVRDCGNDAHIEQLEGLIEGKRLRDVGDLPFDLAI